MGSAQLLEMELAYSSEEIVAAVKATVAANNLGRGLIKMLAYWGEEAIINLVLDSKLDLAIFAIPQSDDLKLDQYVIRLRVKVAQDPPVNGARGRQGMLQLFERLPGA